MTDPVTVGGLVASALAPGANEAGKAMLGAAAKDAYDRLKAVGAGLFGPAVADLETRPDSQARIGVVAEKVDAESRPVRAELQQLAEVLHAALAAEGRGASINNSVTVIASGAHAIAAGRDAIAGARREPNKA